MGASYWHYTVNELGMEDVAAQIDHIHVVKCSELRGGAAGLVAVCKRPGNKAGCAAAQL